MELNQLSDLDILDGISDGLRKEFHAHFQILSDDLVSPQTVAFRDAIYAFPCPTEVLVIEAGGGRYAGIDVNTFSYGRFDLTRIGERKIDVLGRIRIDELAAHESLLERIFKGYEPKSYWDDVAKLMLTGLFDETWLVVGGPWDATKEPHRLGEALFMPLVDHYYDHLVRRFDKSPDFTALYNLKPKPKKSLAELLHAPFSTNKEPSPLNADRRSFKDLIQRWEDVREIMLIPKVPDDVVTTFEMACDEYVFAAFRYYFGTVCLHYAYLAVEAAIKHRWIAAVRKPLTVRNRKGAELVVSNPMHQSLFALESHHGKDWNFRELIVDGKRFPAGVDRIVEDLVERKIITQWHAKRLGHYTFFRNTYSHREFGTITPCGVSTLKDVAWSINTMFHSA